MVNMNENGRKNYKCPEIKVVELDTTSIIAQSDPTGETDPWGEGE